MVTYRKVFDPGETSRRLNLIVRLPETLAGLSETPYRQEALLIDHILRQWVLAQIGGKSIEQAIEDGSLRAHIEQALDLAKKDRQGVAHSAPSSSSSKGAKPSHAPPLDKAPTKAAPQPDPQKQAPVTPETVTVTPETKPETQPVTDTVTSLAQAQNEAGQAARTPPAKETSVAENSQTMTNDRQYPANEEETAPPPPGVANRFSSMFED